MCFRKRLMSMLTSPPKMDYHSLLQLTGYLTQSPKAVETSYGRGPDNRWYEYPHLPRSMLANYGGSQRRNKRIECIFLVYYNR